MPKEFVDEKITWQVLEPGIIYLPTTSYVIKYDLNENAKDVKPYYTLSWRGKFLGGFLFLDIAKNAQKLHAREMLEMGHEL